MINLPDVSLICISSIKIEECLSAIKTCMNFCKFYDVKFVTDKSIADLSDIKIEKCEELINLQLHSDLVLTRLHKYFDSNYCLLIQDDGFISNPDNWSNDFLMYDYIGAPWPLELKNRLMFNLEKGIDLHCNPFVKEIPKLKNYNAHNYRVGNGGFSLRSKKLCEFTERFAEKYPEKPEDNIISIYEKEAIENNGMKIAPIEIAAKFSIEYPTEFNPSRDKNKTFGFHRFL
jgi:hypothetical protein